MTKTFQIPGSKSIAQRALICAALCEEPTIIENLPAGADVQNLLQALRQCGIQTENPAKNSLKIIPSKLPPDKGAMLFVGHGGTPLRFLTSFLCQIPGTQKLDGSERLRERPIQPLLEALNQAGAKISFTLNETAGRDFPLQIGFSQLNSEIEIEASASSQFLSSIMLSGKALGKVRGPKTSSAYLKLTIQVLADFGITISEKADYYEISGDYKSPRNYVIEPDWASAGYILGTTLLTNSRGKIKNLPRKSLQPDAGILPVLEKMGLEVLEKNGFLEFSAKNLQSPGEINCQNFPDSAQTIAVLAAFCEKKTTLTGLETLPFKECQRLEALQSELKKLGVSSEISRDSLKISPHSPLIRGLGDFIQTFHDHRMALSFGMAQSVLPDLKIENPSVVAKSFPNFWNELAKFKNPAKKMAIIGDPVEHSLTPLLYNSAFAELGLNFICEKCPVSRENIHDFLRKNPYQKLAITAPHKEIAGKFILENSNKLPLDKGGWGDLSGLGINSLRYDGKIRGKNTDIPGFREVLANDLQKGQTVLILGAGNTAESVLEALKIYELKIFVHNRTHEKAENLAKKFGVSALADWQEIRPDLIISTLPFDCEPEIPREIWATITTIFAIGYNGLKIPRILQTALQKNKKIRTGGDLLWAQWKYQFEFLFDRPAPQDGKNLLKSFTPLTK